MTLTGIVSSMKIDYSFSWELLGLLYAFFDNANAFLTDLIYSKDSNCRLAKHLSMHVVGRTKYDAVYLIIFRNITARREFRRQAAVARSV
jgi:uncharacterized membrane protein